MSTHIYKVSGSLAIPSEYQEYLVTIPTEPPLIENLPTIPNLEFWLQPVSSLITETTSEYQVKDGTGLFH